MIRAGATRSTASIKARPPATAPKSRAQPGLSVAAHGTSDLRHMLASGSTAERSDLLLHLQRVCGNQAVQSLVVGNLQRKKYQDPNVAYLAKTMPALERVATRTRNRIGR